MNRFILKTSAVSLAFLGILAINFLLNSLIIENTEVPIKRSQVLIAGDSHPQFALNPDIFYSAENISQTGEPYVLTYWKLKYLFSTYRPEILILGFSHHNISAFNDYKFVDKKWSGELFRRSYLIADFHSLSDIEVDYPAYYQTCFRKMFLYPHNNHFTFVGKYTAKHESNISDIDLTVQKHYYRDGNLLPVSENSVAYLDSIVTLCSRNNVTPKLVGSPVHPDYYRMIPPSIFTRYNTEKERLAKGGVSVYDLTHDFYDDSYYFDEDHLNDKGAFIFTNKVIELMWEEQAPIRLVKANNQ